MTGPGTPRAVGRRVGYDDAPEQVRRWVDAELGSPVVQAETQVGGMSPGPAARLRLADGRRFFVKAVGPELNPHTPRLFRHEIEVLRRLPRVDYRPALVAAYDEGGWVALVLEDVEGSHPDLSDPEVMAEARRVVREQTRELTPDPLRLPGRDLAETVRRWSSTIAAAGPDVRAGLPVWWHEHEDDLTRRLESLPDRVPPESWIHLDVRDDNLLLRPDGRVVVLDWGMARSGPPWVDEVLLALHDVTEPVFDERVAELPSYDVASDHGREDAVTDLVLALGMSLAVLAQAPPPEGLPRLSSFRREESARLLVGARRRLGL